MIDCAGERCGCAVIAIYNYKSAEPGWPSRVGPFLNYVNLIDCSFSTTDENDIIPGRSYAGPILPLVQRPPGLYMRVYIMSSSIVNDNIKILSFFWSQLQVICIADHIMWLRVVYSDRPCVAKGNTAGAV